MVLYRYGKSINGFTQPTKKTTLVRLAASNSLLQSNSRERLNCGYSYTNIILLYYIIILCYSFYFKHFQINEYTCSCTEGWTSSSCETDINECDFTPPICQNGGSCENRNGSFVCFCPNNNDGTYYTGMEYTQNWISNLPHLIFYFV